MRTSISIFALSILWLTPTTNFAHPFSDEQEQPRLTWKEHRRQAEKSIETGKTLEAAYHFEAAWKLKRVQKELVYQAGALYAQARDYAKAVQLLAYTKDDVKDFPAARYKYALSLKQSGQYDEAARELVIAINTYVGKDRNEVVEKLQYELSGCSLGIQMEAAAASVEQEGRPNIKLEHLNENINSIGTDFAPVLFGNDILYFTSDKKGALGIHRSQQIGGEWRASDMPKFPLDPTLSFGNGCFSPDASRFYYSQQEIDKKGHKFSAIYVIKRAPSGAGWAQPIRLRNYINADGATTTHPFVTHQDGVETLYFASNRRSGHGGMDLWSATREISSPDIDFTVPRNLGKTVNSAADEVTPFYDIETEMLYFASNGKHSIGGLDIFKTKNTGNKNWDTPENMGLPYNSAADDYYFIQNRAKTGGFFTSNRRFAGEKVTTVDDDIFGFSIESSQPLQVKGTVVLKKVDNQLNINTTVSLYEKRTKDDYRLLSAETVAKDAYQMLILPNKTYRLEVERENYTTATYDFATQGDSKEVLKNFVLEPVPVLAAKSEDKTTEKPMGPAGDWMVEMTEAADGLSNKGAPKTGTYYRVQLATTQNLDASYRRKLERVESLGRFDIEWAANDEKKLMIGEFETLAKANKACKMVQSKGFKTAFPVKYEQGKRVRN
jgi:tetratricopeptide (TPR) repeat protein